MFDYQFEWRSNVVHWLKSLMLFDEEKKANVFIFSFFDVCKNGKWRPIVSWTWCRQLDPNLVIEEFLSLSIDRQHQQIKFQSIFGSTTLTFFCLLRLFKKI